LCYAPFPQTAIRPKSLPITSLPFCKNLLPHPQPADGSSGIQTKSSSPCSEHPFSRCRLSRSSLLPQKTWWVPSMQLSPILWKPQAEAIEFWGLFFLFCFGFVLFFWGVFWCCLGFFYIFSLGGSSSLHSLPSSIFTAHTMAFLLQTGINTSSASTERHKLQAGNHELHPGTRHEFVCRTISPSTQQADHPEDERCTTLQEP